MHDFEMLKDKPFSVQHEFRLSRSVWSEIELFGEMMSFSIISKEVGTGGFDDQRDIVNVYNKI